ncbi:MAG: helix-turn-helix transcriptional regulator [Alphaproteobacteria bacterium]
MKPAEFKRWRKSLGFSQKDAAHALGIKRRVVQYYEKGERDGKKVAIPLYIRLACFAVQAGITDFDGTTAETDSQTIDPDDARQAIENVDVYDTESDAVADETAA